MNEDSQAILNLIENHLKRNPSERFTQALFNLGITEFADKNNPEAKGFLLRDIYNDADAIVLERITNLS